MGWVTAPALVAGLSELPKHLISQGNALRTPTGQTAGALAAALFGAVVATRMGDSSSPERAQSAYNSAFLVAAAGVAVAFLLAARLPVRARRREPPVVTAAASD